MRGIVIYVLVIECPIDNDTLSGDAVLPEVEERAVNGSVDRCLNVTRCKHDERVFPAELEDDRLQRLASRLIEQ